MGGDARFPLSPLGGSRRAPRGFAHPPLDGRTECCGRSRDGRGRAALLFSSLTHTHKRRLHSVRCAACVFNCFHLPIVVWMCVCVCVCVCVCDFCFLSWERRGMRHTHMQFASMRGSVPVATVVTRALGWMTGLATETLENSRMN